MDKPAWFNAKDYLDANPDIAEHYAWLHYSEFGVKEEKRKPYFGRPIDGSPPPSDEPAWFDADLYLEMNPKVAEAGFDGWDHYSQFGHKERARSPYFGRPLDWTPPSLPRMIVDTDMSAEGDPDDVQCYIAQASSWPSRWDVRGIVSTVRSGRPSAVPFIENIVARMHDEVSSKYYRLYPVFDGDAALEFYKREIDQAHADGVPLEVHIWGSIKTFSRAARARLGKLSNVTVYWVANWNRYAIPEYQSAWDSLKPRLSRFAGFYRDEEGFRGIMRSGDVSKLNALQEHIKKSPVAAVYNDHPIRHDDAAFAGRWKAGDLSLYFYATNHAFRDGLFKPDMFGGYVADGPASEKRVAQNDFRDAMVNVVKRNVNRV